MNIFKLCSIAIFVAASVTSVQADVLTESFDDPNFGDWKTRWFGQYTNAALESSYNPDYRGNNVTGLTIFDGNRDDGRSVNIFFDAEFGATITNFSFDILNYTTGLAQTLTVFDINGNTLFSSVLDVAPQGIDDGSNNGYDFAQENYVRYSVDTTNGIGGFRILPFGSEGNVSIDNLSVTIAAVPEPSSWAMMMLGAGVIGAVALRRRKNVVAAAKFA
ncbi:PEP-CTERM sorting domain-containing protein [Methylobacillus pratensis]